MKGLKLHVWSFVLTLMLADSQCQIGHQPTHSDQLAYTAAVHEWPQPDRPRPPPIPNIHRMDIESDSSKHT